jgi:hypothetical protein
MPARSTPVTYDNRLADALTRRRFDSAIKPLTALLSLQDLLNAEFCKNVTQELAVGGRAWEVQRATPELWQQIPDRPGLYMFVFNPHLRLKMAHPETETALPRALYVGRAGSASGSGTLRARYRTEYKNYVCCDPDRLWEDVSGNERKHLLRKYLNLWPLQYWYLEIAERETIARLEKGLIKLLNPPLNYQGTAKLRPVGLAGPAF